MLRGIKPRQSLVRCPPSPSLRPARSLSRPLARSPQPRHAVEERETHDARATWRGFSSISFFSLGPAAILIASAAVDCYTPAAVVEGLARRRKAKGEKKKRRK